MQSTKTLSQATKLVVNPKLAYRPAANTAQNNTQSWATVTAALAKGPQTYGQLQTLLATAHNHSPFVGYAVRRGWLITTK